MHYEVGCKLPSAKRPELTYKRALVFAAGLVLGFEIFAKRSIEYDIDAAFSGARDVLSFLAAQSPQAGHYYEILTLLSNAISKQRENVATAGRSRYVSKIFTLQEEDKDLPSRTVRQDREPMSFGGTNALNDTGIWLNGTRTPADDQDVFLGWDTLDISQWDNFPFVT